MTYDCTQDVRNHQTLVGNWLEVFAFELERRSACHDDSKLEEPEKSCYDTWTPVLEALKFGTSEYEAARAKMGEGLAHHYANNSHHPEHHANGIGGMNLFDIAEMFTDWLAACEGRSKQLDLDYLGKRFNISTQLLGIFLNTAIEIDRRELSENKFIR